LTSNSLDILGRKKRFDFCCKNVFVEVALFINKMINLVLELVLFAFSNNGDGIGIFKSRQSTCDLQPSFIILSFCEQDSVFLFECGEVGEKKTNNEISRAAKEENRLVVREGEGVVVSEKSEEAREGTKEKFNVKKSGIFLVTLRNDQVTDRVIQYLFDVGCVVF